MIISRELCVKCKGRLYCGLKYCPLYARFSGLRLARDQLEGSNIDVFVGRYNYPNVNFGIINVPEIDSKTADIFQNNKFWLNQGFSIDQILSMRSNTVYNYKKQDVKNVKRDLLQEMGLSIKPIYLSVYLKNRIDISLKSFKLLDPFGGRVKFEKIELQDTPEIPQKVDKLLNESSEEAVIKLRQHFDENYIRKVFSVGALGISKKLVPTRWSITAVDDILGKDIMKKIKEYEVIANYKLFFGSLFGNYFLVLLIPSGFMYELFEMYTEKKELKEPEPEHDYELFFGRKEYAKITAGGYYASRLGVLEYLNSNKIQAGVVVFRFITPEYKFPLGVWVVREAVRKAMSHKIREFFQLKEALQYILEFSKRNFLLDLAKVLRTSQVLIVHQQRKISSY